MQWKIFQFVPSRYISQMTNRHESMYTSPNDSIQSLIIVIIITLYIQLSILPINILFDMMSSVMWSKKRFPLRKNFKVLLSIKFFFLSFPSQWEIPVWESVRVQFPYIHCNRWAGAHWDFVAPIQFFCP